MYNIWELENQKETSERKKWRRKLSNNLKKHFSEMKDKNLQIESTYKYRTQ